MIERCALISYTAHCAINQRRKYTNDIYFVHPECVANRLNLLEMPQHVVGAAYLHDVLEDTKLTYEDLTKLVGDEVANLVLEVTDISKPSDGNRAIRKAIDREHIAKASYYGKCIKLADLIDNSETIIQHDPNFSKIYMEEKRELLKLLKDGHPVLFEEANKIVEDYYKEKALK